MIDIVMGIPLLLLFVMAQGGVIFGTAYLGLRALHASSRSAKAIAMLISCTAWLVFTVTGYILLGGEGGLMDGFLMLISVCFTAMVSSAVYTFFWMRRTTDK